MTQIKYPTRIHKAVDDSAVLDQLPTNVLAALGTVQETGYHLMLNRRDIYCEGGTVQYVIGDNTTVVQLEVER